MARRGRVLGRLPPHVHVVIAARRSYYYFQASRGTLDQGPRVKLFGEPYGHDGQPDPEWWLAYRKAAGLEVEAPIEVGPKPGSVSALVAAFEASAEFAALKASTQSEWRRNLKRVEAAWGPLPVAAIETKHVLSLRDRFGKQPATANNLMRALSSVLTWGLPRGWSKTNPCLGVKKLKGVGTYSPWSWDEIVLFRTHARPRLWQAAALALYSGQRQADVLKMRWSDLDSGMMHVVQEKTGAELWIPMHADLKAVLAEMPRLADTILTTERGSPWGSGFKASWQAQMDLLELASLREAGCVFHGLRKSAVVFLLEAGCTDAEVSAITGQSRQMVEHYARQVNKRKLAASAVLKWERAGQRDKSAA